MPADLPLGRGVVNPRELLARGVIWLIVGEDCPALFPLRLYHRSLHLEGSNRLCISLLKLQHHDIWSLRLRLRDLILEVMICCLPPRVRGCLRHRLHLHFLVPGSSRSFAHDAVLRILHQLLLALLHSGQLLRLQLQLHPFVLDVLPPVVEVSERL